MNWLRHQLFWAVLVCLGAYYFWLAGAGSFRLPPDGNDIQLLNLQVEAYEAGQLALERAPDPRLLSLPNPYDPEQNRGLRLLDATLFEGKYYTYFGPAPLALVLWPWYTLTGTHANPALAALGFALVALLFQALALRQILVVSEGGRGEWGATLALTMIGLCAPHLSLIVSHETFDLPVLGGMMFASVALYCALRSVATGDRATTFMVIASLSAGLAAGSRAALLPGSLILVLALVWATAKHVRSMRSRLLALGAPWALCVGGLAIYNAARFHVPWEFGNRYTLVEVDWGKTDAFSLRYLGPNLYAYLLSWPRWEMRFPYLASSGTFPFPAPAGYLIDFVDRVWGILPLYPMFVVGNLVALWRATARTRSVALRWSVGCLALYGVGVGAVIMLFVGASVRYASEFLLPFLITGAWGCAQLFSLDTWRTLPLRALGLAAVVVTASSGFLTCFLGHRGIGVKNAQTAATVSELADRSVGRVLRAIVPGGFPKLEITFPTGKTGQSEPLWVHGRPGEADFLYVYYASPTTIQLGFESMGRGGPLSEPVPIEPGKSHVMEILAGPFLPPGTDLGRSAEEERTAPTSEMLCVKLDGRVIFNARVRFHAGKGIHQWGESPDEAAFGRTFTGSLKVTFSKPDAGAIRAWHQMPKVGPGR